MLRIFIIVLSLLFMVAPAKAYWLDPPKPEPFTMHGARETAPPSNRKGLFTVQDNFNLFTKEDGNTPILLPHSDYFVAADIINANLPILGIFSQPMKSTGDPISNLIYADLKLKKLVEQYSKLQEKANNLLHNQHSILYDETIENIKPTNINLELRRLSTKLSTVNTGEINAHDSVTTAISSNEYNSLAITLHQLKMRQERQREAAKLAFNASPNINQPTVTGIKGQTNSKKPGPTAPSISANHGRSFSNSGKATIPFIIMLPFKLFNYTLTHKLESLLIGFFIVIFIGIIFGPRS